jgi:hypothetical protein
MRTLGADGWTDQTATEASPEAIRDIIVSSIFRGRPIGAGLIESDGTRNLSQRGAFLPNAAGDGGGDAVLLLRSQQGGR